MCCVQEGWDGPYLRHAWGRSWMHTRFWWGNLKERSHVEDVGIDKRIILKLNLWNGRAWTEFICLRIGTSGWLFWTWQWTISQHNMREIPWLAEAMLASQEGFCSMQLILCTVVYRKGRYCGVGGGRILDDFRYFKIRRKVEGYPVPR
jgi:hypothetical protein